MLHQFADRDGEAADLDIGCRVTSHLDEMAQRPGLAVTKILVSVAFGSTLRAASRAFFRRSVRSSRSLNFSVRRSASVAIRNLAGSYRLEPYLVQLGVPGDDLRLDERAFRLVDKPLAQLRKAKARPMANELVGQASAHTGDEQVVNGVLEHRPCPTSSRWLI